MVTLSARMRKQSMVQRMLSLVMVNAFVVFVPQLDARTQGSLGREINVAAAAETNPALAEIARSFEGKPGVHVRLKFGKSEALYSETPRLSWHRSRIFLALSLMASSLCGCHFLSSARVM